MAEERRLFYVAVTRAERELRITWAAERTFGAKVVRRRPSPYLDDLEPLLDALAAGTAPGDAARSAAGSARHRARPHAAAEASGAAVPHDLDPADRPLFDDLRTWRTQRAKAAGVPAYVIFDDKTLVAVATRRPRDPVGAAIRARHRAGEERAVRR